MNGDFKEKGALHVPRDRDDHWVVKAAEVVGPAVGTESVRKEQNSPVYKGTECSRLGEQVTV